MGKMKGLFFTMDALVALTLFLATFILVSTFNVSTIAEKSNYQQLNFITEDAMHVFSNTPFYELNESIKSSLIENTNLSQSDLNKSMLDIAGKLWAYNETAYADDAIKGMLDNLIPEERGYSLVIKGEGNSTVLYASKEKRPPKEESRYLSSSSRVISGYEENIPSENYVASAWAVKAEKNTTRVFSFAIGGSGWNGENATFDKYFELPNNTNVLKAELFLSIHYSPNISGMWVNDVYFDESDVIWNYRVYDRGYAYGAYGIINSTKLKEALKNSTNHIKMEIRNTEYNSHLHPGMLIQVAYTTDEIFEPFEKKFYFDNIIGRRASWEVVPFHVPKGVNISDATLHVEWKRADKHVSIWVNDHEIYDKTNPTMNGTYNASFAALIPYLHATLQGGDYISTGETNTISVYIDMNPNGNEPTTGAKVDSEISNNSYIEVNYTSSDPSLRYGMIEVTAVKEFDNGPPSLTKSTNFTLEDREITKVFIHPVQYYSWMVAVCAWHTPEEEPAWQGNVWSNFNVFKSPTGRSVPSTIYIPLDRMQKAIKNYIKLRDGFSGGSSDNLILPESTIEYSLLIPSQVGYGNNFNTEAEAIADANNRLNALLGQYASATSIENNVISMINVPWMWGPSIVTLEVWK